MVLVIVIALLLLVPAGSGAQTEPARLSDVTVTPHADSVTVFVKTSREAQYKADLVDSPNRLVIDLEDTVYAWRKTPLSVGKDPLKQIRGGQYRQGVARVVLDLSRTVGYAIREEPNGLAIVIPTAASAAPTVMASAASPAPPTNGAAIKNGATHPGEATAKNGAAPSNGATQSGEAPAKNGAASTSGAATRNGAGASELRPAAAPIQIAQAPAQPAPATNGQRLISFDFKDADVVNLLRILAAESNKNVVIGDDVKGKMSISLRNVPWDLALDTILETRGLRRVEKDNVLRIVSNEQLIKEREAAVRVEEARLKAESDVRARVAEAQLKEQEAIDKKRLAEQAAAELAARGPLKEETIRLSYADPEDIARTLQGILGIPAEGIQAQQVPIGGGMPPIPGPPFSALYGTAPQPPLLPAPVSASAEVLSKGITIRAHKPTNSLFIRHYENDLERIKKLIREKLDIPLPQVKIEARMEILDRDDLFALGVQWGGGGVLQANSQSIVVGRGFTSSPSNSLAVPGTQPMANVFGPPNVPSGSPFPGLLPISALTGLPLGGNLVNLPIVSALGGSPAVASGGAGGIAFGITGSRYNVNLALEALRVQSKTRTLARPEIVTVENATASISLGEEIPYATVSAAGTQYQFKEALLKLDVVPTVIREGDINKIKMKVIIENNSRGQNVILGTTLGSPPAINKRKAQTEVLIKEGERLVIGGVTTNLDVDETRKVPLFGDIPILGWLFKTTASQTTGRELVVFITPSVLKVDVAQAPPATQKK
jgi:type IV pilus secretin PilQ/predicted competence protein